ncbi:MAG TPA: beta-propeller fold lactonase family protein [Gemmatimonadaceae bacterium]
MRSSLLPLVAALSLAACGESALTTSPRSQALGTPGFDVGSGAGSSGAVFTQTNAVGGNAVVAFARAGDGSLTNAGTFSTGGNGIGGTNDPLASQYSLILDGEDARLLFVVNAGSNTISRFAVDGANLTLLGTTSSRGTRPVSLAVARHTLYVLNTGSNSVAGFDIGEDGALTPNVAASALLGAAASGGAAVRASRDGQFIVVTETGSRTIDVYRVGAQGALGQPVSSPSSGISPFGFDFVNGDQLAVSEAGSAAASLYDVGSNGVLDVESASVSTHGQAAPAGSSRRRMGGLRSPPTREAARSRATRSTPAVRCNSSWQAA